MGGSHGWLWVVLCLIAHAALLAWSIPRQSPTTDEPFHLAAGVRRLQEGRFDIDRGNPPLAGTIAALPVVLAHPQTDWRRAPNSFAVGTDFMAANGARSLWLTTLGRCACIPFSLLGGYICFRWSCELYGYASGLIALVLWCFCPNILAHGQLVTGDMAATAFGITAFYAFWKWLVRPSWEGAALAGIALGIAELTKYVWVLLYLLWPVLWVVYRWARRRDAQRLPWFREAAHGALMVALSVYLVNLGYLFDNTLQPLGQFRVGRKLLERLQDAPALAQRIGTLPVPLPADYVGGIDEIQQFSGSRPWTYLRGERRATGSWYYYPYALALKLPLGTLLLFVLACALWFSDRHATNWSAECFLAIPIVAILCFVTWSGVHQVLRYVLPVLPFAYIWMSKTGQAFSRKPPLPQMIVAGCLAASVLSSLLAYPHSLSYYNELAGGPERGYRCIAESNIDWGQDLLYLAKWLDEHPEATELRLAYFGRIDPRCAGIQYTLPPKHDTTVLGRGRQDLAALGPQPGWYAISVNLLLGFPWFIHDGTGRVVSARDFDYAYFGSLEPVARAGYSIHIYYLTLEDANRVRRQLSLPEL